MFNILSLRKFVKEGINQLNMDFTSLIIMQYTLFEDKNGAIGLATSPSKNPRMLHIAVNYHFPGRMLVRVKGS